MTALLHHLIAQIILGVIAFLPLAIPSDMPVEGMAPVSRTDNDAIPLAFGVMVYQKQTHSVDQTILHFSRLMDLIYSPLHLYTIHVDIKSSIDIHNGVCRNKYCTHTESGHVSNADTRNWSTSSNCICIPSRNIGWAGQTTAEMMLALMQTADEFTDHPWQHFILIGN